MARPAKRYDSNHHPFMKAFIALCALVVVVPLLVLAMWSFISSWPLDQTVPTTWSLRGYEAMLSTGDLFNLAGTSIGIGFVVSLLCVVIATMAGWAFIFYDFPGRKFLDFITFLPAIVPAVVMGTGIHVLFINLGLSNTLQGVIITHMMLGIPFAVKILSASMKILGRDLEDSAIVLGASPLRAFFGVTFHSLVPSMISAACMAFTCSFADFFLTFLIGGGQISTFATFMVPAVSGGDTTITCAYAVVYVVLGFLFFFALDALGRKLSRNQDIYLI